MPLPKQTMKYFTLIAALLLIGNVSTFAPTRETSRQTSLNGLFDFFSEEARQERAERDRKEKEEQMRLQQEILERRQNPAMMEEYEERVSMRRKMYEKGEDGYKAMNDMMNDGD